MGEFDSLDISELFATTTAINTINHSAADRDAMNKKGAFERFGRKMQDTIMMMANVGLFKTFAVLVSSDARRYYRARDDESVGEFAKRLHSEAISMNARWSFVAMLAPYAVGDIPGDVETTSMSSIIDAVDTGALRMGICFFSEKNDESGNKTQRSGVIELDKSGTPQGILAGSVPAQGNPFTTIMDK